MTLRFIADSGPNLKPLGGAFARGAQSRNRTNDTRIFNGPKTGNPRAELQSVAGSEAGEVPPNPPNHPAVGQPVGQNGLASAGWDRALSAALEATADELAAALPADAVERALADALRAATEAGRYADAAELARALEARQRARAGTVDLSAERARRAGRAGQ